MNELQLYNNAKRALTEAKTTDEVKTIRDKAIAIKAYAEQAKDKSMEADAYEIRRRAERRLGEMMKEQRETVGMNDGAIAGGKKESPRGSYVDPRDKTPTLADAGIDKHLADTARKSAALSVEKFEEQIDKKRDSIINGAHVSYNSGENEWYTPKNIIELAREVMGSIDTDPASSALANETVKATVFYTESDNGLTHKWVGNVWLNPPYAQPLIADFCKTVASKYACGEIQSACVLVNNATETAWFNVIAEVSNAICFPRGRVKFIDKNGNPSGAPLQGQAILYMGDNIEAFAESFSCIGLVVCPIGV